MDQNRPFAVINVLAEITLAPEILPPVPEPANEPTKYCAVTLPAAVILPELVMLPVVKILLTVFELR